MASDPGYDSLRDQIEGLLTEARLQSQQAHDWAKVEAYWHIGHAVASHIDAEGGPTYGQ
jgi:hypothetical protein